MYLSTVRQHYKQGFSSALRLVEQFEMEIENLTLACSSIHHNKYLRQTVNIQKGEIERLHRKIKHKSQQLLDSQRSNHQLRKLSQFHLKEKDDLNHRWQRKLDKLIIDLGPEAEETGGEIIFEGLLLQPVKNKKSASGIFLNKYIKDV